MRAALLLLLFALFISPLHAQQQLHIHCEILEPFSYMEKGILKGTNVNAVMRIMKQAQYPLQLSDIQVTPWARAYRETETTANTALFSTARTEQREHLFKWVEPLSSLTLAVFAKKERSLKITNAEDMQKYRIGTIRSSAPEALAIKQGHLDTRKLLRITEASQSIRQLESERIDLFAYAAPAFEYKLIQLGLDPKDYEIVYTLKKVDLYLAFNKSTDDLIINNLNNALKDYVNLQKGDN